MTLAKAAPAEIVAAVDREISVRPQIRSGALRVLLPDWSMAPLPIHAVDPTRGSAPAPVRAFAEFVRAIVRARRWDGPTFLGCGARCMVRNHRLGSGR
jgi:DNA-binding transcriptional LysR family regulator